MTTLNYKELEKKIVNLEKENQKLRTLEDALRESEERFHNLMEYIPGISIQGYRTDGIVVYWNKASEQVYGYSAEEAIGKNLGDLIIPPDLKPLFRKALESGKNITQSGEFMPSGELMLLHKNGHLIPVYSIHTAVNVEGKEPLLFCIDVNLTEQKIREEALRKSEKRYRDLIENLGEGISIVNMQEQIIYVNPAAENIFGVSHGGLIGRNLKEFTTPQQFALILEQTKKRCMGEKSTYELEIIQPGGEKRSILITATPQFNNEKQYTGAFGIFYDITERKRLEKDRKKLEELLFHSQKMESVGRLAGGIAHDFNNILTSVLGYAELLKMQYVDNSSNPGKAVNIIIKGAKRAADLTQQLLGFARGGRYNPIPLNINDLIEDTMKMSEKIFEKNVEVFYNFEKNISTVEADKNQMHQVLTNIIINARDAMPTGGKLFLKTENVYISTNFSTGHFEIKPGNYVRISITDTGIGMTEVVKERIFEPFFTTKEQGKGTGLGLSMVYGIIQNHHGYITTSSNPGKGATFSIYLPETNKEILTINAETLILKGNATLLIIDDEEDIRNIIGIQLENLGYKILTAIDGQEGIDIYKKNNCAIDLVVLDMIMPNMAGSETYYELKKLNPAVKVLLISGYSQEGKATELLNEGALGFLRKPFDLYEISNIISKTLMQ